MASQNVLKLAQRGFQRGAGIDIGRRTELIGNGRQGNGFGVQDAVFQGKLGHGALGLVVVLTSLPAGLALPSSGSDAGPGGISSRPFMPQAARLRIISKAAILDMFGALSAKSGMVAHDG